MQPKGIFLILFIGLVNFAVAQPADELQQYREKYPGVPAVILEEDVTYHFEITDDSLRIYEEIYREIFYLTEVAGYWKEMEIGYSGFSEIVNIDAKSLIPGKSRYKTIKVKEFKNKDDQSSEVFHDDYRLVTFDYSGLQKGSKSQLSYTRIQHDPHLPGREFLQSSIPIEHKTFTIIADKSIEIGIGAFNLENIDYNYSESEDKNNKTYKWEVHDIESLKKEDASPSYAWYGPHIIPYVKSYVVNHKKQVVLSEVDDLFNWYGTFVDDLNEEIKDPKMQALVDSIIIGAETDLEKVKQIFYWTQDNIKYIAIEYGMGGFIPRPANSVCTNRYGDCKDMASTITGLLDYAGIESHLTWVGTNDIPYTYSELPTPNVDNHMIATYIDKDNRYHFMDATGRFSNFNLPSSFILGKQALIRKNKDEFEVVTVPVVSPDLNKISEKIYLNIENTNLVGRSKASISGYNKTRMEYAIENKTNDEKLKFYKQRFSKGNNKFLLQDFQESNLYPIEKPLEIDYSFSVSDYILANKDEMYINLNLAGVVNGQKIKEDRQTPIQNNYPIKLDNTIELEIPDGWEVDYVPESLTIDDPDIAFNSAYEVRGNKIILNQETSIRYLNMTRENFDNWNKNIDKILKYQNEIIILKQTHD